MSLTHLSGIFSPPPLALPGYAIDAHQHISIRQMESHTRGLTQMNVILVTGVLVVVALLVRGLLVLAYAHSSAYNVQRRLQQYAKR